jgi:hypothetical protein
MIAGGLPHDLFLIVLVQLTARGISRFVLGYPSLRGGVHPPAYGRVAIVSAVAFAMLYLIAPSATAHSPWVVELCRGLVLASAGVALARWCRASERSPVFLAIALVVPLAAAAALRPGSPGEALTTAARLLMRLPLDASALWAGWHVAAVRGGMEG